MLTISGEIRVFLIILGLQPHIHNDYDSLSLHLLIMSCFSLNEIIVGHISAKHKLAWCCLQCCVICASNSIVTMQLIEGSNQMDYLLVLLDFHDCFYFPSKMIWEYDWQFVPMCTHWMIAFACGLLVVTCSWFGFNAIIDTHLFELTFEFAYVPIVKDNKLRSRITCQPGVMKQILDGCCWLICGFDNFKPTCVDCWINHCEFKQRLCFGWCPYCECKSSHQIHTDHDPGIQCQILLFWVGVAHISCMYAPFCHLA
jgi:hypothetical protein